MLEFIGNLLGGGKRREPFAPDLLDLVAYEKEVLYARAHGHEPLPPSSGFLLGSEPARGWTPSEVQAIRDNRDRAFAIYRNAGIATAQ